MAEYFGNAFSLQMLTGDANVSVIEIEESAIPFDRVESRLGHKDIADMFGMPVNRIDTRLQKDDVLYVAQYIGPRLPEGCCQLPEGAEIRFFKVTTNYITKQ